MVVELLDCAEIVVQEDDVYFYDRMAGAVCYHSESDFTVVRRYSHAQSIDQVLEDWTPLLNSSRQVVKGDDWFVLGRLEDVTRIAAQFPGASDPTSELDSSPELTPYQDELTTCTRFATSLLTMSVEDPAEYRSQSADLDGIYPGLASAVATALTPETKRVISEIAAAKPPQTLESFLSTLTLNLKVACAATLR